MNSTVIPLTNVKRALAQLREVDHLPMFDRTEKSWKKFQIEKTGEYFWYSNYDNGIYDADRNPVSKVTVPDQQWLQNISETRNRTGKSSAPYWIRILLGHACNYSCSYCLQKDIGNPDERGKITTTDSFIEQLSKLDLSKVEKIDLWGGEPFLYWKSIMPIMEHFDRPDLTWFISTNGTTLLPKHVEFFAKLKSKVEIGISHDATQHEALRGPEFLYKKIDVLKSLQALPNVQFSFNCVVTKTNYDLFEINNFFQRYVTETGLDRNKIGISYIIGRNHDYENIHNSAEQHITGDLLESLKSNLDSFLTACAEQFVYNTKDHGILKNSLFTGSMGVMPYMQTLKQQVLPTVTTSCGADDSRVLSVDMNGNVRTCPHVDESFISGHLNDLSQVKLKHLDLNRYEKHCSSCEVYRLCKSNCPIEVPDEVFYSNCSIEKVWYGAIQNSAFRIMFNSEVTLEN
jgi:uncharacterized protein